MVLKIFYTFLTILAGILLYQVYLMYDAKASLSNQPAQYMIGPEDADLIVTEFLDYSCSYCQIMYPTLKEAMEQDGRVRLAPRPLFSNNNQGTGGAYIFYTAAKMGKAQAAHEYLFESGVTLSEETLPNVADHLGVEFETFQDALNDPDVFNQIQNNHHHFKILKGHGTPTFFIGPDLLYVADGTMPTVDDFLKLFAEARSLK